MPRNAKYAVPWWYYLVATPFGLAAVAVLGLALHDIVFWHQAKGWIAVPATILEVDLLRGRRASRRVVARYRYEFNGVTYENDGVGIHSGGDNFGGFQQEMARSLRDLQRKGVPVWCHVNPANPHEALLHRELRLSMLLVMLLVGGGGICVVVGVLRGSLPAWRGRAARENAVT